jgi:hypothetical protein
MLMIGTDLPGQSGIRGQERLRAAMLILIAGWLGCGHERAGLVDRELELFEEAFDDSLVIRTTSLPTAVVGTEYTFALNARGGLSPTRWKLISGKPPEGVELTEAGVLRGTPALPGVAGFIVKVEATNQPPPSRYGGLPHVYWRERQFMLVVRDRAAAASEGNAAASRTEPPRRRR